VNAVFADASGLLALLSATDDAWVLMLSGASARISRRSWM
jgi:hypothetical protein